MKFRRETFLELFPSPSIEWKYLLSLTTNDYSLEMTERIGLSIKNETFESLSSIKKDETWDELLLRLVQLDKATRLD